MKKSTEGIVIVILLLIIVGLLGGYIPSLYKHFTKGKVVVKHVSETIKVVKQVVDVNTPVPTSIKRGVLYTNKTGKDLEIWANMGGNKNNQMFLGTLAAGQKTFIPAVKGYMLSTTFKGFFFEATRTQNFVEIGKDEVYKQDI
jgi:hypothetical protein